MNNIEIGWAWIAISSLGVAAMVSCGPEGGQADSSASRASGSGGESSGGSTSSAGGSGNSDAGHSGSGSFSFTELDGGSMTRTEPDATCAATSIAAEAIEIEEEVTVDVPVEVKQPVTIYLMQDRSSSMIGTCASGDPCNPEGWNEATDAITAFVTADESEGIDVGLGYFPPLANDHACDGSTCKDPAVPVAPLPGNASAIIDSLAGATPTSSPALYTPTECALRGMTAFCKEYMEGNDQPCVAVLASDGAPTRCNEDTPDLAQIAKDAFDNDGVLTFTLGMSGADFDALDAIAEAGGTDCDPDSDRAACDVTAGQPAFLAALNNIRETVVVTETRTETVTRVVTTIAECEWTIPEPDGGRVFDPNKVNVAFSSSAETLEIGRVPSADSCSNFDGGWHFDDPGDPETVIACPDTCDQIKAATDARVDLSFGCETVLAIPR